MSGWETRIQTGNPQMDEMTVGQHRQAAAAQGLALDVRPLPGGGYIVRAYQAQAAPQGYGGYAGAPQPQAQPQGFQYGAQPAMAAAGAGYGGVVVGGAQASAGAAGVVAAPLTQDRLKHIRKVYTLLAAACFVAIGCGFVVMNLGTEMLKDPMGHRVAVPTVVAAMLRNPGLEWGAFGLLFVSILLASAVTKVRGLNVVMLFLCAGLMGLELSPMAFLAQWSAGYGGTLSANPVRDTFIMVGAVFAGITAYVYITRKDFSYLGGMLSMGAGVIFAACFLAFFLQTEIFSLAVASAGALLSCGFLLFRTSRIFTGPMDDAVGDALGFLITLRNLFMFILRILMSSRR